jgi:sugar lactone lactonase YvrE
MHHDVKVTHSRIEVRYQVQKEGTQPNGLHYDSASDQLLVVDQADGDLITIANPRHAPRESVLQAGSNKPSGVVRTDFGGRDTVFMASTYGLAITQVRGEKSVEVDCRGVGTGIVDFAKDLVNGTHTGYHGLEWDGEYLWAASPPGKAIFKMRLEESDAGTAITSCSWFPVVFGNRPHGLAWADQDKTQLWCNDTTLHTIYRYDVQTAACREIVILPQDAPQSHGMTIIDGHLWYCEDQHPGRICEVIPL